MGWLITVVPRVYTFYASTILFAVVGGKLLREGLRMSPDEENEELEEVTQVRKHNACNSLLDPEPCFGRMLVGAVCSVKGTSA
jgi:hypothetical protein